ncbi:gtp-binding protein [Stylonychia lemnae]|uniref:Gtp-binding protein n=1 Tax=Stylonychia lemnae TaxID=5949 RepID=A0A078A0G6_STYLE|nr:gtp-binding protein [Stylonychia lemnae]|eukprot:CDW75696.1 gtp-binding protein [Stylonychia lemnae]
MLFKRPLQAVRLLQKEREERETDDKFSTQKEDIIQQAQELERRKNEFKKEQQNMINYVRDQISVITQNANKRKNEEAKLEQEKAAIEQKKAQIVELEKKLEVKKTKLGEKREELERHRKFNKFLEDVVNESGDNKEFQDIDDLQNRFKNLKSENQKLMKRISEKNSALEQDFENEINKKNKNSKEIGQIINSINNIFTICRGQQHKRGKMKNIKLDDVNELTPNLVQVLIERLEMSSEVIEDLVEVFKIIDNNYDRDKAYTEALFNTTAANNKQNTNMGGNQAINQKSGTIPKKEHNDTTNKINKGGNNTNAAGDIGKAGHKSAASGGNKGQDEGLGKKQDINEVTVQSEEETKASLQKKVGQMKHIDQQYRKFELMMDFKEQAELELKQQFLQQGTNYFVSPRGNQEENGLKLVHTLDYKRINDFVKGVKENDYLFYDDYPDLKEVVIMGSANVGKSSLINALNNGHEIAYTAKTSGKTQELNFYLAQHKIMKKKRGIIVDTPGYGFVVAPIHLKEKWRKMVFKYLGFGVRINMIMLLVNGKFGLKSNDIKTLEDLKYFNKPVQVVLTKIDQIRDRTDIIKVVTDTTGQLQKYRKFVYPEVHLTSADHMFGIKEVRAKIGIAFEDVCKIQFNSNPVDITPSRIRKF